MLQAPQNVKAFPGDNPGEIKITWNPVEGADYYGIDWSSEHLNEHWHQPYHGVVGGYSNSYTFVWSKPEEETGKFYFTLSAAKGDWAGYYSEQVWSYLKLGAKITGPDSIAILEAVELNGKAEYSAGNNSFLWALENNTANCSLLTSNQENTTIQCTQTGSAEVKLTITAENGVAEYNKTITVTSQSSKGYGPVLAT